MRRSAFRWMCLGVAVLAAPLALAAPKSTPPAKEEVKMLMGRPITREQFEQLDEALSAMGSFKEAFGSGADATWEVLPRYSPVPAPASVPEGEVLAALQAARTFSLSPWFGRLRVSADLQAVPNFPLAEVAVQWKEVRDAKGRKVALKPPSDEAQKPDEKGAVGFELEPAKELKLPEELTRWKGTATATFKVPVQFQKVSFSAADVGQTKEGLTLKAWKGAEVTLDDARGRLERAELVGLAANGLRLGRSSYSSEQPEQFELLRKLAKGRWEDLPAVVEAPANPRIVVSMGFTGTPARLDVYLVERAVEKKLAVKLVPAPKYGAPGGAFRVAPARNLCEGLTAASLQKQVRVFGTRSSAMMGHGRPELAVQLPFCDNSAFSEVEFDGLKYLDAAGKPLAVPVETESSGYMADAFGHELRFNPKLEEGQEQKDAAFRELARVEGLLKLDVPRLRVLSLTGKAPEADGVAFTLKGNKVTVRLPSASEEALAKGSFLPEHLESITAYDAKGRLLARDNTFESSSDGEFTELTYGYAGKPERVDVLLADERLRVEVPFKVTLPAPPPPAAQ